MDGREEVDEGEGRVHSVELHPKRTTSFARRFKGDGGKAATVRHCQRSISVLFRLTRGGG